jgi:enoyl-CoA hydratase
MPRTKSTVTYKKKDGIAIISMNRPEYNNAQNGKMTYDLDKFFKKAVDDDDIKVIVLKGNGKHFSAGHDIGTPGRDVDVEYDRKSIWYDHTNKPGGEFLYVREQEVYLNMCRRWRDMPKPTIAMVHGACVAGGCMLAWICDLIVASEDAFFADPVVRMGIPGVEYSAQRAYEMGMVNRVVPLSELESSVMEMASKISAMPRLGLTLTKQAINHVEDLQGKRNGMEAAFAWHHFSHAHNDLTTGNVLAGFDAKKMAKSQRKNTKKTAAKKNSSKKAAPKKKK